MTASPATPVSCFARNGDVRIHYVDTAPSDDSKPPLLFVPGITDTVEDYVPILRDFGRRTLVAELRGRGRSDSPPNGYGFEEHVGDVGAVAEHAGLERFHLCTFSRGTGYALGWSLRHPERLLSVSIGDYLVQEIRPPEGWAEPFMNGRWRGRPVRERLSEVALRGIEKEAQLRPLWDQLAAAGVPVLVMRAGKEGKGGRSMVDEGAMDRYRSTFTDVEIVTFEESDHDLFRPDPTRYPKLVRAFIDRHDP